MKLMIVFLTVWTMVGCSSDDGAPGPDAATLDANTPDAAPAPDAWAAPVTVVVIDDGRLAALHQDVEAAFLAASCAGRTSDCLYDAPLNWISAQTPAADLLSEVGLMEIDGCPEQSGPPIKQRGALLVAMTDAPPGCAGIDALRAAIEQRGGMLVIFGQEWVATEPAQSLIDLALGLQ